MNSIALIVGYWFLGSLALALLLLAFYLAEGFIGERVRRARELRGLQARVIELHGRTCAPPAHPRQRARR